MKPLRSFDLSYGSLPLISISSCLLHTPVKDYLSSSSVKTVAFIFTVTIYVNSSWRFILGQNLLFHGTVPPCCILPSEVFSLFSFVVNIVNHLFMFVKPFLRFFNEKRMFFRALLFELYMFSDFFSLFKQLLLYIQFPIFTVPANNTGRSLRKKRILC